MPKSPIDLETNIKKGEIYTSVSNTNSFYLNCANRDPEKEKFANVINSTESFLQGSTFLILEEPKKFVVHKEASNPWSKSGMGIIEKEDPFYTIKVLATTNKENKKTEVAVKYLILNKHLFFSSLRKLEE